MKKDKEFALKVRKARKHLGLSQREVAEMCFMTRANIMHIEGFKQKVFLSQALALAYHLEFSLDEMK